MARRHHDKWHSMGWAMRHIYATLFHTMRDDVVTHGVRSDDDARQLVHQPASVSWTFDNRPTLLIYVGLRQCVADLRGYSSFVREQLYDKATRIAGLLTRHNALPLRDLDMMRGITHLDRRFVSNTCVPSRRVEPGELWTSLESCFSGSTRNR